MHVIADRSQVTIATAIHHQRFVAATKQMTEQLMAAIKAGSVNAQKPFHAPDQVGLGRFHHQMKMVQH